MTLPVRNSTWRFRSTRPPQPDIPPTKPQRDELLRVIQHYVTARKPVPPLSASELRMHADSIIRGAGVDEAYRKFVTVMINNEVWRDAVAAVPYHRRLLLLPKCFRHEEHCVGTFDQFGLKCRRCGQCAINDLAAEAERLGYAVLIAEGSAVVTATIESAKLEAVIGVSCLSVLERVFPHMESAAIPGLAIPLLADGCRDTTADFDWVWDAIYVIGDDKTRRLNLDRMRSRVEAWFAPQSLAELVGQPGAQTEQIARDWLAQAGKRWRPFLVACAFAAFGGDPEAELPRELARLAVAVECFHKASLIHDDIEDDDKVRYGQQTLHERFGVPIALNVGDFLLGEGYRLIAASDAPLDRKEAMLAAAIAGHRDLCLGQGEELAWMRAPRPLSPAEVLAIFRQKTAPAFHVALRLGALYAGAAPDLSDVLGQYSAFLGIAYQVRDDLEDFDPARGTGLPAASAAVPPVNQTHGQVEDSPWRDAHATNRGDARALRPSLLLAVAHELACGPDRQLTERIWRRDCDIDGVADRLDRIFAELNVRETTSQLLESYKAEAVRSLSPLANANLKGLLRRVIGRIFNETELKGWCGESEAENAAGREPGAEPAA